MFGKSSEPEVLPPLPPFEPPLGPQPPTARLYSPTETTLVLKEKILSFSGEDFTVKSVDGRDVVTVKGKVFSVHKKKLVSDLEGNEIYTLNNHVMSLRGSFTAESPTGFNFEIKGKFKLIGSHSVVEFKNASDGQMLELDVTGSWLDRKAEIKVGDRVVARVTRKLFNNREIFGGAQTYYVQVAPNVDLSMIVGVCISIDDREERNNN